MTKKVAKKKGAKKVAAKKVVEEVVEETSPAPVEIKDAGYYSSRRADRGWQ